MIKYINIQNFKSIKDSTFHLKEVNLLIGANNSGKSNFLKVFQFLSELSNTDFKNEHLERYFFDFDGKNEMIFTFILSEIGQDDIFFSLQMQYIDKKLSFIECIGRLKNESIIEKINLRDIESIITELTTFDYHCFGVFNHKKSSNIKSLDTELQRISNIGQSFFSYNSEITSHHKGEYKPLLIFDNNSNLITNAFAYKLFSSYFKNTQIYKPNISSLTQSSEISKDVFVKSDASNLVSFFDEISNNFDEIHNKINRELKRCVGDIVRVSTPTSTEIINKKTIIGKKLRFSDQNKNMYWADEVSDGVLYFLALLAIVYQPNPPKILLLEEPEIGIHPNRIREIIDYIFEIAEEKNIQIILTTHSPFLVELFKDLPENIFVFNKNDGITTVKNLQFDIIVPEDIIRKQKGLPLTDHLNNISTHWTVGLLGGVPAI